MTGQFSTEREMSDENEVNNENQLSFFSIADDG